jgi:outer membrane protein assembly factor BamB
MVQNGEGIGNMCKVAAISAGLILALTLAWVRSAEAGNWSRFRGPNGSGITEATTIPVKWGEDDYNWKMKLPGCGHSSPVVWEGKLFVSCADEKSGQRTLLRVDSTSGKQVWRRDFASKTHHLHSFNSYASSTPVLDAERVYITRATPEEVTLQALGHDGRDVWRRNLGAFESMHGSGSSPILFGELVILAVDKKGKAFIIAVDRKTGKTRWRLERRSGLTPASTPCVHEANGTPPTLIFSSTAHGLNAVDPTTGKVVWGLEKVFLDRCVGSPISAGKLVIASYGHGSYGTRLVAVQPGSMHHGTEPKIVFDKKKPVSLVPTPITKDGLLYLWIDQGRVICLDAVTGDGVWNEHMSGTFFGSPICVNDRLYCISMKGEVVVIATGRNFKLLARNPLGEKSYSTPAVANGTMFLRTFNHLVSVGGGAALDPAKIKRQREERRGDR